ncbi:transcriptional regulator [Arsenophonus nasoniae]|uniref:YdaS family helix-turn-helix protein n=1 Tax=Arsenophonus nasoniae TaxID=638 RepID=A0AA95K509_9GAMM|nr:YdaS family helix-turn-helix protein [Arsenophonus nasoniae]WGM00650.1 YdaS family helix-turn-helix protein [Arsenophonus nasoniae]
MDKNIKNRIAGIASQTEIANFIGHEPQAISSWFKNGVPPKKVLRLCEVLEWQVTPHELRPDIYPNPTDGIPADKQNTI